mmetsp:Transcript_57506/g.151377  ORF Transcript_57506/g.151377 Transcript_57506/m.151377 type:complete len:83 (+) Transcript_57506:84-332(+)
MLSLIHLTKAARVHLHCLSMFKKIHTTLFGVCMNTMEDSVSKFRSCPATMGSMLEIFVFFFQRSLFILNALNLRKLEKYWWS